MSRIQSTEQHAVQIRESKQYEETRKVEKGENAAVPPSQTQGPGALARNGFRRAGGAYGQQFSGSASATTAQEVKTLLEQVRAAKAEAAGGKLQAGQSVSPEQLAAKLSQLLDGKTDATLTGTTLAGTLDGTSTQTPLANADGQTLLAGTLTADATAAGTTATPDSTGAKTYDCKKDGAESTGDAAAQRFSGTSGAEEKKGSGNEDREQKNAKSSSSSSDRKESKSDGGCDKKNKSGPGEGKSSGSSSASSAASGTEDFAKTFFEKFIKSITESGDEKKKALAKALSDNPALAKLAKSVLGSSFDPKNLTPEMLSSLATAAQSGVFGAEGAQALELFTQLAVGNPGGEGASTGTNTEDGGAEAYAATAGTPAPEDSRPAFEPVKATTGSETARNQTGQFDFNNPVEVQKALTQFAAIAGPELISNDEGTKQRQSFSALSSANASSALPSPRATSFGAAGDASSLGSVPVGLGGAGTAGFSAGGVSTQSFAAFGKQVSDLLPTVSTQLGGMEGDLKGLRDKIASGDELSQNEMLEYQDLMQRQNQLFMFMQNVMTSEHEKNKGWAQGLGRI